MLAQYHRARLMHRLANRLQSRFTSFSEPLESRVLLSYSFATVATFHGSDGANPSGTLLDNGGNLFGVSESGGADNFGSLFEFTAGGSKKVSVQYSFTDATDQLSSDSGAE